MASRSSPERCPTLSASVWEETNSTTVQWPPSTPSTLTISTSWSYVGMLLLSSKPVFVGRHEEGAGRKQKFRRAADRAKQGEGIQGQVQAQRFVFVLLTWSNLLILIKLWKILINFKISWSHVGPSPSSLPSSSSPSSWTPTPPNESRKLRISQSLNLPPLINQRTLLNRRKSPTPLPSTKRRKPHSRRFKFRRKTSQTSLRKNLKRRNSQSSRRKRVNPKEKVSLPKRSKRNRSQLKMMMILRRKMKNLSRLLNLKKNLKRKLLCQNLNKNQKKWKSQNNRWKRRLSNQSPSRKRRLLRKNKMINQNRNNKRK